MLVFHPLSALLHAAACATIGDRASRSEISSLSSQGVLFVLCFSMTPG